MEAKTVIRRKSNHEFKPIIYQNADFGHLIFNLTQKIPNCKLKPKQTKKSVNTKNGLTVASAIAINSKVSWSVGFDTLLNTWTIDFNFAWVRWLHSPHLQCNRVIKLNGIQFQTRELNLILL